MQTGSHLCCGKQVRMEKLPDRSQITLLQSPVVAFLSTYGKSSNFQGVFLYAKKILRNKTGYAYYITKPQCKLLSTRKNVENLLVQIP